MINQFLVGAVEKAFEKQGKLYRYKDSFTLGLVALVWIATFVLEYFTGLSESGALAIGVIGNFAAMVVTRLTPGAITPSMARRVGEAAEQNEVIPETPGKHAKGGSRLDQLRASLGG